LLLFFEDGWAIVPAGKHNWSQRISFWEVICLSVQFKNVLGKQDLWKERISSIAVPMKLDLWEGKSLFFTDAAIEFSGSLVWPFDAACCAAGKAYHWEGCI